MRLSANNLNKVEKVNFEGVKQEFSIENEPVYRFTTPRYNPDKEMAALELVYLDVDEKTKHFTPIDSKTPRQKPIVFEKDTLEIKQSEISKDHNAFAYRYVIIDKDTREITKVLDDYQTVKFSDADRLNVISENMSDMEKKALSEMNVVSHGKSITIAPKAGVMIDMLKDSGAVMNKDKSGLEADKIFFRNHFLKLGGSIEGLNWLLKNTNVLYPYRYIKTTPDMSMDKTSSHGYWPNNIYQSPDKEVLDDFIFELYKRGKGYVADGAYTSQSVQSPLFQHVLKYGKESPFYNMMKINGDIKLGMLPTYEADTKQQNFDHIGVRIVNPKGKDYDKNKPTYIQFYDDRLSSAKQRTNTSELIDGYDVWPDDPYEITTSTDSVQPLYFEVNPNDPVYESKIKVFKTLGNNVLLKDINKENAGVSLKEFLIFPNFEITTYDKSSGVVNWDGNTELIKMNLTNPANNSASSNGMKAARRYVINAVDYWSENTQADLILRTAKIKNQDTLRQIALANEITKKEYDYIVQNPNKMQSYVLAPYKDENGKVVSKMGKPVEEYVKNYQLQSIETSSELSAIFSEPEFNKEFFNEANVKTITNMVESVINEAIPAKYKDNEEYKAYVTKTYGSKIIKTILAYAMNSNVVKQDGSIDIAKLNDVTLKSLTKQETATVKEERKLVVNHISNGVHKASKDINAQGNNLNSLKSSIRNDLSNISLEDFKIAEAIVLKGKAGINWRFDAAKDIADLDSVRDGVTTFDKVWYGDGKNPGTQEFWDDVTSKIREYNPSSYIINEITSLWEFYDQSKGENFSSRLTNAFDSALPDHMEIQFLQESNSTTSSNYAYYFNKLSNYIGCDPEFGNPDNFNNRGNLGILKWQMKCFNEMNQTNGAMYSHVFWENYDKPRILHILALGEDQKLFYMDGGTGFDGKKRFTLKEAANDPVEGEKYRNKIASIAGDNTNYERMSPKAIAVGIMLQNAVKNSSVIPQNIKQDVIKEIKLHALGKKSEKSFLNRKRAERFGVLPYELSMADIFKKVGVSEDEVQELTDNFCYEMLKDDLKLEERLWQTVCAMGGMSTIYSGMEYGQTGYESSSHNIYQANRGATLHHRYDVEGFREYYDKINAISSLYLEKQLSSLKEGYTVYMGSQTEGEHEYLPVYKYDDKGSKTICVLTNNGIKDDFKPDNIKAINIKAGDNHEGACPLSEGTRLKRKVYDKSAQRYVDEATSYEVKDGNIVRTDGKPINIQDTSTIFYVPATKISKNDMLDYRKYFYANLSSNQKVRKP